MSVKTTTGFICIGIVIIVVIGAQSFINNLTRINIRSYNRFMAANYLMKEIQSSATVYALRNNEHPKRFSDFIVARGDITGKTTMSLDYLNGYISDLEGINSGKLIVKFKPDSRARAIFCLKGKKVEGVYKEL